ncbi:hypothetical protein LCI18_009213 [Fusarium solani-melongenae]|uniref:Uncharacterized protein n=1 Tax=Fusarium solani subsp. cucurbitae TaxID=2747967 RepID=A0ACD3ZB35_FUSSC|nr:hypothetical protein LCI18_009213 [Fusarium solani-melongenae]
MIRNVSFLTDGKGREGNAINRRGDGTSTPRGRSRISQCKREQRQLPRRQKRRGSSMKRSEKKRNNKKEFKQKPASEALGNGSQAIRAADEVALGGDNRGNYLHYPLRRHVVLG